MNVYDSERMSALLDPLGYSEIDTPDDADLIILNTCHIREKAAEKVYSEVGRLKKIKEKREKNGKETAIAIAGCVAQAEGEEIIRRTPAVDMVFGPQSYHQLPELIARLAREKKAVLATDFPTESKFDHLSPVGRSSASAFLTIQEGCDKFCTFCVVPYTRGAEFSRPPQEIIIEATRMVENGTKEITLLGQNVNAYHGNNGKEDVNLAGLLNELSQIDGLERLRFTTSHPRDMDDDLFDAFRTNEKLMPYLHLPVQAGSDKILKAMNRGHKGDDYHRIIDRLRDARPDIALSGDFIVGFPGESDRDFADTLKLVTDIGYAQAYSFKYSPRPGTPAAAQELQVDEHVKDERLQALRQLLSSQQMAFNQQSVGKTMDVLLEHQGKNKTQLTGRTPYMQAVHVNANERLLGEIVGVTMVDAGPRSMTGEIMLMAA